MPRISNSHEPMSLLDCFETETTSLEGIISSGKCTTISKISDIISNLTYRSAAIGSILQLDEASEERFKIAKARAFSVINLANKISKKLIVRGCSLNTPVRFSESVIKPRFENRLIRLLFG